MSSEPTPGPPEAPPTMAIAPDNRSFGSEFAAS
jgi:hypothetical protein